ncbi:UNVERIFIED_CONTAM: hypothetical protein GTU68_049263 [Idotea baltica]|nr:hypothetical protein [Idotea baltica]
MTNREVLSYNHIPRVVLLLDFMLTVLVVGALRASWRLAIAHAAPFMKDNASPALLVGADHNAGQLAYQINNMETASQRVLGLVDPTNQLKGMRFGRMSVLGGIEDVVAIAANVGATDVLVSTTTLAGPILRQLMNACADAELNLKIIPSMTDMFDGDQRIPIRDIGINDLLRRDPVELDQRAIGELITGNTVLVTGGGGSIGSEICRQILRFKPERLVILGRGENRIFHIERELKTCCGDTQLVPEIANITDEGRMRLVFERYSPQVIFHAAAHKHVPLMEANPGEALRNNVRGTKTVADLAHEYSATHFVLISTDKAVNPTSVMGASKQLAERYVHAMASRSTTRFTSVRFGNVLGSEGSVVPLFKEQIAAGGPITVTDERMTRYFMSIPEAAQLVLQSAALGSGGEIYVLDMGEPIRIVDLAKDMIRLAGLRPDAIEIRFSGARPGEKLYEELYFDNEATLPTEHPKIRAAWHRPVNYKEQLNAVSELRTVENASREDVIQLLCDLIPEFKLQSGAARPLVAAAATASSDAVSEPVEVAKPR